MWSNRRFLFKRGRGVMRDVLNGQITHRDKSRTGF